MLDSLQKNRVDLAAAFRWAVRLNYHEGVANHFSVAINNSGSHRLMRLTQLLGGSMARYTNIALMRAVYCTYIRYFRRC
jgi:ribulose-5-phosphate 4-epimerase/fuculose-1-phosphate aldolase